MSGPLVMILCLMLLALMTSRTVGAAEAGDAVAPPREGLRLWLDADDAETIVADGRGAVTAWRDRSGSGHDATAPAEDAAGRPPHVVAGAMNGRPVVRFAGESLLKVPAIRAQTGDVTIFVVSQRLEAQAGDAKWQRLVSHWDGQTENDNNFPSYIVYWPEDGSGAAYEPVVTDVAYHGVAIGPLTIGASSRWDAQHFRGDIAEVLVYDRGFLTEDAYQEVLSYLGEKWGAKMGREDAGWTRRGGLGETPTRVTDDLPLSDQHNAAGWARYEAMWDEFDGDALDASKWHPRIPEWLGRQPALFWDQNVAVKGGQLHLTMRKEEAPGMPHDKGYHTYTSAAVSSVGRARYGYFEVRARPMASAGSSSFWFYASEPEIWTEIDVFEIGGRAPGFARKYNMNAHVFHTPTERRHWNKGSVWLAPWELAEDYHVYGLEWDESELKYYVDGVLVRRMDNTHWHQPLNLIFDSETMPDWLGMPKDEDLPSTYSVDYVRAWKRGE